MHQVSSGFRLQEGVSKILNQDNDDAIAETMEKKGCCQDPTL
jgi:hypothetical protein